jgi:hypothetical protein
MTDHQDLLAREMNQIKIALGRVSVYEGMVEYSPTAMLVDDLVRDHEALEMRIDAVMFYLAGLRDDPNYAGIWCANIKNEVVRLLRGGTTVPSTPESLGE